MAIIPFRVNGVLSRKLYSFQLKIFQVMKPLLYTILSLIYQFKLDWFDRSFVKDRDL